MQLYLTKVDDVIIVLILQVFQVHLSDLQLKEDTPPSLKSETSKRFFFKSYESTVFLYTYI